MRPPASVGYNRSPLRPTLPCRAQEKEEEEEEEEELLEEVSAEFAPCHAMHLHVTALLRIVMACERLRPSLPRASSPIEFALLPSASAAVLLPFVRLLLWSTIHGCALHKLHVPTYLNLTSY